MLVTEDSYGGAVERIARCKSLVVDLETTGLRPYLGDRLFGVAVEADGEATYFPFRHKVGRNLPTEKLPMLLDVLTDGHAEWGGHNMIRFDCPMIAVEDERFYQRLIHDDRISKWDTMIEAMLTNENEPSFSLDSLGQKYLGDSAMKAGNQSKLLDALRRLYPRLKAKRQLYGHMSELPPELVSEYACGDVIDARRLHDKYTLSLAEWGLTALAAEYARFARLLAKIERRGLLIDKAACLNRSERCLAEQGDVLTGLQTEAGPGFNPNSWQQIIKLCGTVNAEAETLERSGHPLAGQIVLFKRLGKMKGTYYDNMVSSLGGDDVIHPQMNLTRDPRDVGGTRSGRLSCSNPNFQNLPKRSKEWFMRVRRMVLARPGHTLLRADYERQEMWLGGHYSGDQSLSDAYHTGRDLYAELADEIGCGRQAAKIAWLAIQYGAGAEKLARMFGWPFQSVRQLEKVFGKAVDSGEWSDAEWRVYKNQEAVRLKDGFFSVCPGIKDMMKDLETRAEEWKHLRLWTGRVIHFDGEKTKAFAAWNRLVQGGSGEMTRIAMQRLEQPLDDYGGGLSLQVHDEIVAEVPEENVKVCSDEMRAQMCAFDFKLQPRVEIATGSNYDEMEVV